MRQIDIHCQCNCQTCNRHRLRRHWKGEGQPEQQHIKDAEQGEEAVAVGQGASVVEVGLLDFAPRQPVQGEGEQVVPANALESGNVLEMDIA
jgi:hypothetical protein